MSSESVIGSGSPKSIIPLLHKGRSPSSMDIVIYDVGRLTLDGSINREAFRHCALHVGVLT